MAYGLDPRLFVADGPAAQAARASHKHSARALHAWRRLDRNRRLALVEGALNDNLIDGLPLAL